MTIKVRTMRDELAASSIIIMGKLCRDNGSRAPLARFSMQKALECLAHKKIEKLNLLLKDDPCVKNSQYVKSGVKNPSQKWK